MIHWIIVIVVNLLEFWFCSNARRTIRPSNNNRIAKRVANERRQVTRSRLQNNQTNGRSNMLGEPNRVKYNCACLFFFRSVSMRHFFMAKVTATRNRRNKRRNSQLNVRTASATGRAAGRWIILRSARVNPKLRQTRQSGTRVRQCASGAASKSWLDTKRVWVAFIWNLNFFRSNCSYPKIAVLSAKRDCERVGRRGRGSVRPDSSRAGPSTAPKIEERGKTEARNCWHCFLRRAASLSRHTARAVSHSQPAFTQWNEQLLFAFCQMRIETDVQSVCLAELFIHLFDEEEFGERSAH